MIQSSFINKRFVLKFQIAAVRAGVVLATPHKLGVLSQYLIMTFLCTVYVDFDSMNCKHKHGKNITCLAMNIQLA